MKRNTWTGLPIHSQLPQEVNFHNIFICYIFLFPMPTFMWGGGGDMGAGQVRKGGEERVARGSNRVERVGK